MRCAYADAMSHRQRLPSRPSLRSLSPRQPTATPNKGVRFLKQLQVAVSDSTKDVLGSRPRTPHKSPSSLGPATNAADADGTGGTGLHLTPSYYQRSREERHDAIRRKFLTATPPCGPVTGGTLVTLSLLHANTKNRLTVLFAGKGWILSCPAFPHPSEPKFAVCVRAPACKAPGPATIQLRVGDDSMGGESVSQYHVRAGCTRGFVAGADLLVFLRVHMHSLSTLWRHQWWSTFRYRVPCQTYPRSKMLALSRRYRRHGRLGSCHRRPGLEQQLRHPGPRH